MSTVITRVEIRYEQDVVHARQRGRIIAELLGFDKNDQTRISTAVSEIARNAYQYAAGGEIEFLVEGKAPPQVFAVTVRDHGPGIEDPDAVLEGRCTSRTGMGLGILGSRRLMDHFHLESLPGKGATVFLGKIIPLSAPRVTPRVLAQIADELARARQETPMEEIRRQNQELLRTMDELRQRQEELMRLNQELEDTNRGVLALYAELDDKAETLRRAGDLKSRFLSNMSHEFRTPLNSMLALSQLLLDRVDGELTEEQEKQVTFIRKGAEDLSALVNDLLDLAKIEAGKTAVHWRECSVAEIFSGLRGMLKPLLASKRLNLVFEEPEGIPLLYTDDGKISQILRNFLSNALKFTERGEIRVSARLSEDAGAVVLSVADTGIGISREDQKRIFEEYSQVDRPERGKVKGTGLGLSISSKLAEMLGGSVGVESVHGVGSTFYATIPIRYRESDRAAVSRVEVEVDATRFPVLVIEDHPETQMLYEKYLKGSGFQTLQALSIGEAWPILARVKPLAIVLDILLPGEDGWKFLVDIKAVETTWDIPVIVASVLEEQDKGMALGAEDYCVKPVERKWLLNKLRALSRSAPLEKALIIDDEEVARYILKGFLADTRYGIVEANNGPDGLRVAQTERPDVIFLDLAMPDMTGFEVLDALKNNSLTRNIPVIIVTTKVLDEEKRRILNAQALAILSKEGSSRESTIMKVREALRKAAEFSKGKDKFPNG